MLIIPNLGQYHGPSFELLKRHRCYGCSRGCDVSKLSSYRGTYANGMTKSIRG